MQRRVGSFGFFRFAADDGSLAGGPVVRLQEAGDIFPDHVELEVDGGAGEYGLEVGMFEGVRDDGEVEFRLFYIEDGEADAVEADGAFFDDEVAEFFWEFEAVFPASVSVGAFEAGGGGVDMSLDDVAVEAAVHDHATFEVDEVAGSPGAQVGFFEGLFDGCDAVEVVF